ncbi:uncharacterized protein K489DRAFT_404014 [Dissoconium aciculare CBS 342.82]|uniref:Uncharacterized protein n=1 Tax=Dissoconium aciculare CBS 342.82 TaxID=1314786 RepID=A0A6J3LXK0_9PEZI|nr:uncharacterized protein K489DRAFT_404014 [Dissoconium aciculare CBS 342.82]KAF1820019.1 hypothetical protein K489DRAFT_404014 [Dissoconium aciculare CBS 342.82]
MLELQEHLFLVADSGAIGGAVSVNPFLKTHFDPLFACHHVLHLPSDKKGLQTDISRFADLIKLPWAYNGTQMDAAARQAYARPEASWRKMLITQPPVAHLDWWHFWKSDTNSGWSRHECTEVVTIGMLWDWLKAVLIRECDSQIVIFPGGCALLEDPSSSPSETTWARRAADIGVAITDPNIPRIKITTHQSWPGEGPSVFHRFNMQRREWEEVMPEHQIDLTAAQQRRAIRFTGEGTWWLISDCQLEGNNDSSGRWSKSDAFQWIAMREVTRRSGGDGARNMAARSRIASALEQRLSN